MSAQQLDHPNGINVSSRKGSIRRVSLARVVNNSTTRRQSSTGSDSGLPPTDTAQEEKELVPLDILAKQEAHYLNSVTPVPGRNGAIHLLRQLDTLPTPPSPSYYKPFATPLPSPPTTLSSLTVESPVAAFRSFQKHLNHPADVLNIRPEAALTPVDKASAALEVTEFETICMDLVAALSDFEMSVEGLTIWKDEFMGQTVPSIVKVQLTLLFARFFRSKSNLHEPLFELVRQVRLYSKPWSNKKFALLELEKDYQRQGHVLDVAIRKLEQLQQQISKLKSERKLALWERLVHKICAVFIDEPDEPEETEQDIVATVPQVETRQRRSSFVSSTGRHTRRASSLLGTSQMGRRKSVNPLPADPGVNGVKEQIRAYITTTSPAWIKPAKTRVRHFETILRRNYPRFEERLIRVHRNPFAKPNRLSKYTSIVKGSLIIKKIPPPNMPRSWSLLDARHFVARRENAETIIRCNSFGILSDFRFAKLKNPKELLGDHARNVPAHPMPPVSGAEEKSIVTDDENDEDYEDDPDAVSDFDYFADFDSALMDDLVERYMNPANDPSQLPDEKDMIGDGGKDTFNMQDVMELTLLHAQQMHLMQKEYEDRIRSLENTVDKLKHSLTVADQEFETKMKLANELTARLAAGYANPPSGKNRKSAETNKMPGDGMGPSEEPTGNESEALIGTPKNQNEPQRKRISKTARKFSVKRSGPSGKKGNQTPSQTKATARPAKPFVLLHKNEQKMKKKVYHGAPFSLTFIERLKWFTDEKLKKMQELQERVTTQEIAANEERLQQLKLLRTKRGMSGEIEYRDAEFVPHPGQVPSLKMRQQWAQYGISLPWGGRFQSIKKFADKPNILNLFDIALRTPPKVSRSAENDM